MKANEIIKQIWYNLEDRKEDLEEPCYVCGSYECKKFGYNDMLKKRYAQFNILDFKDCLKNKKIELERLNKLRRNKMFNNFSFTKCTLCKKKFFKDDLNLNMEMEKQNKEKTKKTFEAKFVHTCSKCNPKYKRMKRAFHGEEFKK